MFIGTGVRLRFARAKAQQVPVTDADVIAQFASTTGAFYDPSDMSTLFQDSAGTVPVTAAGQPVGMMRDKSGNGNHVIQTTAANRPTLATASGKWYLEFDGTSDFLARDADFGVGSPAHHFAGVKVVSYPASSFGNVHDSRTASARQLLRISSTQYSIFSGTSMAGGTPNLNPHVLEALFNGANSSLHVDGDNVLFGNAGSTALGAGLCIGSSVSGTAQYLNMRYYGGIILGKQCAADKITINRSWVAGKAGVTL